MTAEITFQDLPEAVILNIFAFVAGERICNLFRLRVVCKKWSRLSTDSSLWRKLYFPNCEGLCYKALDHVLSWCGNVKEVILSNCNQVDDACVESIAKKCGNLEILDLKGCRLLSDRGLKVISTNCRLLRDLKIVAYKTSITCNILKDLITSCKSLQELTVICEKEEDSDESNFFLTNQFFKAAKESDSLKRIYFHGAGIFDEEHLTSDLNMFNLLSIGLLGCIELNSNVLWELVCTSPKLQSLDVSFCPSINDAGIAVVAQVCPNLLQLIAEGCPGVTDVSIETVAEHCKKLQ